MRPFSKTWSEMNRPRGKEDLKSIAANRLIEQGLPPSSFRGSESESAKDVAGKWNAAVAQEAQAIKESRDPNLRRKEQLTQRESAKAKADAELKKSGLTPQDMWSDEPGMARTTYTERTGKKMEMPKGTEVEAVSREMQTPEGGLVRQIAGPAGFGSIKMSKEAADKLAQQREKEERQAFAVAAMREKGAQLRMDREKKAGEASLAKRESWEAEKRAFAEGQQIQREARRRLTKVNRALRGASDFERSGRRGEGYGSTLSAEEFNALLEEQAALKNTIAERNTLKDKGLTNLGRQAEINRRKRAAEAEQIREATLARVLAAQNESKVYDPANPYNLAMLDLYRSTFDLTGGFGLPGVPYPAGK
jgi:hypothetical protein